MIHASETVAVYSSDSSDVPDVDGLDKSRVLMAIKAEMELMSREDVNYDNLRELQEIVGKLDLSVLETKDDESNDEFSLPSPSKRRKTGRNSSGNKDPQARERKRELEEAKKQIKLVEKALGIIYGMEHTGFKQFISKRGKKERPIKPYIFFKRLKENAKALPLWVGKQGDKPPRLCGGVQADKDYICDVGDLVAALVQQNREKNWILAEIVSYDPLRREYLVDDIYEAVKKVKVVSWKKVIPLPKMKADPDTNPEALFRKDCLVLALYPETTCFYPAAVGEVPKSALEPYKLLFEDESCNSGFSAPLSVHQRYVIRYEPKF